MLPLWLWEGIKIGALVSTNISMKDAHRLEWKNLWYKNKRSEVVYRGMGNWCWARKNIQMGSNILSCKHFYQAWTKWADFVWNMFFSIEIQNPRSLTFNERCFNLVYISSFAKYLFSHAWSMYFFVRLFVSYFNENKKYWSVACNILI